MGQEKTLFSLTKMNARLLLPFSVNGFGKVELRGGALFRRLIRNCIRSISLRPKPEVNGRSCWDCSGFLTMCLSRWEKMRTSCRPLKYPLTNNCAVLLICSANLRSVWNPCLSYWDPAKNVNCPNNISTLRINMRKLIDS